ncbi:MAG: hypothetical protein IMZ55_04860 [Acidobacteria bacterium]|nr:hypothetical protein [Acidobacteriota bacterium]
MDHSNIGRVTRRHWPPLAEPGAPPVGVACPKCGCGHAPVINTRHHPGRTVRYRQCRNCGRRFTTIEVSPADVSAPIPDAVFDLPGEAVIEAPEPKRKRPRKRKPT